VAPYIMEMEKSAHWMLTADCARRCAITRDRLPARLG
jgi:hypothetical protein